MKFNLVELNNLLTKKELIIDTGVKLLCGDKVTCTIQKEGENVVITFDAPFVYIFIDTLGKAKIFDIKRKLDKIIIAPKTITVCIDNFPDITKERDDIS